MMQEHEARWQLKNRKRFDQGLWRLCVSPRLIRLLRKHIPHFAGLSAKEIRARVGPNVLGRHDTYFERTTKLARLNGAGEHAPRIYRLRMIVRHGGIRGATDREFLLGWKTEQAMKDGIRTSDEHEERLDPALTEQQIFARLRSEGWHPEFVYEDIRTDIHIASVAISVRQFPFIGQWLEIEGDPEAVCKAASVLGLRMEDAASKRWEQIFRKWCAKDKRPETHMVFPEEGR